jgi:ferredoxin
MPSESPQEQIHLYRSAPPEDRECDTDAPKPRLLVVNEVECSVTVRLAGTESTVPWRRGTVLLDALTQAGIDAPYSCREGSCCVCVCRLVQGRVTMPGEHALEQSDIADGYILACQSLPDSDTISVTYDD